MKITETGIEDLIILEPQVFTDNRGYFFESYRRSGLEELGIHHQFIQDNESKSSFGVIRGLHFQKEPHSQAKLVRVLDGCIYDVAVDIRPHSPTFGKWFGMEISADNKLQLLVPGGFAHGFSVLSEHATLLYKCDAYYHPDSESGIRFDDPILLIDWKIEKEVALVSDRDRGLPFFKDL